MAAIYQHRRSSSLCEVLQFLPKPPFRLLSFLLAVSTGNKIVKDGLGSGAGLGGRLKYYIRRMNSSGREADMIFSYKRHGSNGGGALSAVAPTYAADKGGAVWYRNAERGKSWGFSRLLKIGITYKKTAQTHSDQHSARNRFLGKNEQIHKKKNYIYVLRCTSLLLGMMLDSSCRSRFTQLHRNMICRLSIIAVSATITLPRHVIERCGAERV